MGYFSADDLATPNQGLADVPKQFAALRELYLSRAYKSDRGREYAHGLARRLETLMLMVERAFKTLPPERDGIPKKEELLEAEMARSRCPS
jgi:hypothetical protein